MPVIYHIIAIRIKHSMISSLLFCGTPDKKGIQGCECVCVYVHMLVHVKGENGLSPRMCSKRFIRAVVPVNQSSALPGTAATFPTERYY